MATTVRKPSWFLAWEHQFAAWLDRKLVWLRSRVLNLCHRMAEVESMAGGGDADLAWRVQFLENKVEVLEARLNAMQSMTDGVIQGEA